MRRVAIAGIVLLAAGVALGAWFYAQPGCEECRNSLVQRLTREDVKASRELDRLPQFLFGRGVPRHSAISPLHLTTIDGQDISFSGTRTILYRSKEGCHVCSIAEATIRSAFTEVATQHAQWIIAAESSLPQLYIPSLVGEISDQIVKVLSDSSLKALTETIGTEVTPAIALIDENSRLVALWRGFDPARGEQIHDSLTQFLTGEFSPEHAGETLLQFGEVAPDLPVPNWRPLGTDNARALVYVTNANCSGCREIHEHIIPLLSRLSEKGVDVRIIDTTADELIQEKRFTYVSLYTPELADHFSLSQNVEYFSYPDAITVIHDPQSEVRLAWASDVTPNVFIFNSRGEFERAMPARSFPSAQGKNYRPFLYAVERAVLIEAQGK
jgi:thiol-disulfide isomerase/thioredoxin